MKKLRKTEFYLKISDFFKRIRDFIKGIGAKKIVIGLILVIFLALIVSSFFKKTTISAHFETSELSFKYEKSNLKESYTNYFLKYENENSNVEAVIDPSNMVGATVLSQDEKYIKYFNSYKNYRKPTNVLSLLDQKNDKITINYDIPKKGLYYFEIDYLDLNDQINDNQISILVNDRSPFFEAQTIKLPSLYYFEKTEFSKDRYKNEIQPSSIKKEEWQTTEVKDYDGMHPGYFAFYLKPGDTLKIEHNAGKVLIGEIRIIKAEKLITYKEYLSLHPSNYPKAYLSKSSRELLSRTSASIRLRAERDPSSKYYNTQYLILNTISGDSWINGGQAVNYELKVEEAGFYKLAFKYRQAELTDMSTFRKIYINGKVPYKDLEVVSFPFSSSFINRTLQNEDGEDLYIYLNKGVNLITLEVVNYPYRNLIETIKLTMREIQELSLAIKKYTSGGTDMFRDWDIEHYFPDAKDDLLKWSARITDSYNEMVSLSFKSDPTAISNLKVAAARLERLSKDINKLPSRMVQFSDGDSSVSQLLGGLMQRMMRGNLELEQTIVYNEHKLKKPFANIFVSSWEGFKQLLLSYFNNPYEVSGKRKNELMVWVNHPRQYIEIMQMLIDSTYDSGDLKITLSQMPDENRLILANTTNQSPDLAIGVNHWLPYEFAIRNAALDLRQFEGFEEIVATMSKGAFIPMVFEDGVYGIPETQNFWVTYYRRDILESIGITEIPQTWDEVIAILPLLQSYGANYFVPLAQYEGLKPFVATLPFIYQFEGDLYTPDGMMTAINSEETIKGIKLMSDLFTLYNLPQRVGSFYNDFRYGLLPIGIADLSVYLLLSNAAVELDGLWQMDLHPGQKNSEGEILRYAPIGGQSSIILSNTKYPEESFRLLKWWMSTEVQKEFQFRLETTYGKQYFWNSANNQAFMASSIPSEFKEVIFEQWKYGIEAARIPGTYMVERSISNAWSEIVYNGDNPRLALDEAVRVSNREISYKMAEFGYVKNGVVVKNYIVPSIYNIDLWLTEVEK